MGALRGWPRIPNHKWQPFLTAYPVARGARIPGVVVRIISEMAALTHRAHVRFIAATLVVTQVRDREYELTPTKQQVSVTAGAASDAFPLRLVLMPALAATLTAPTGSREADAIRERRPVFPVERRSLFSYGHGNFSAS